MLRACNVCKIEKHIDGFGWKATEKRWSYKCKECAKLYAREYNIKNKELIAKKNKERLKKNKEIINKRRREWCKQNPLKILERSRRYREKHFKNVQIKQKEWRAKNKDKINNYIRQKRKENVMFRFAQNLRGRIRDALRGNAKSAKTMELLGCDIEFLKKYLESQFKDGMSWENWGVKGWHVDHIIPCDLFDLTKQEEQRKCFHYTNLQPLWAVDNWKKSNKIL